MYGISVAHHIERKSNSVMVNHGGGNKVLLTEEVSKNDALFPSTVSLSWEQCCFN